MSIDEIAQDAKLPIPLAKLAQNRQYDEAFRIISGDEAAVIEAIETQGLRYTKGGRYHHLMGNTDKGKAVSILTSLYKKEFHRIITIGIGDSPNDQTMLTQVSKSLIIKDNKPLLVWKEIMEIA
jgi:Predicted hydrolase (HAD superfamily)